MDLGSELDPGPRDPDLPSLLNCHLLLLCQTLIFPAPWGGESPSPPGSTGISGLSPHPAHAVGLVESGGASLCRLTFI